MDEKNKPAESGPGPDSPGPARPGQGKIALSTGGVFERIDELARAIKAVSEKFNFVNPGGAIGDKLPQLHAVGMSFVFPDPIKETYAIPGTEGAKVALTKNALDKIAAAAGVRWNPHFCGRVDDGSSPYVVEYQAAGTVLQLDGTERMIHASKRIDLRAEHGAPVDSWGTDAQEIARVAAKAVPAREPWPQILQARQHILSLAESKAKNRAIRSLGVRTSYEPNEIEKGFAVMKLQFTGESDDPELKHEVGLMIARRALDSSNILYPGEHRELQPGPAARVVPKITDVKKEEDAEEPGNGKPAAAPAPAPAPAAQPPAAAAPAARVKPASDPLLIYGKKPEKGPFPKKPCSEFTAEELKGKIAYAERNRSKWDPKWAAQNEEELLAMKAWLAFKEFDPNQPELKMDGSGAGETPAAPTPVGEKPAKTAKSDEVRY